MYNLDLPIMTTPIYLSSKTHNTGHAFSKITGMRGAKAGDSSSRRSPLANTIYM